ncbi:YqcC family protein [Pseudomonas cavernae]|uniref:YqcC family protein n=1 Tax=Pseudomonas cavernae TaxID=2320867 RepID=A0A385Z1G3_9PSED|nr:YqcC family protein [Pseudomonas cavernae]AYC31693.1 YqcC family protein [Pseudomonas cavernae]
MDTRLPVLAEQLLLIERELRLQGWWADEPPSAEALASQEPFCVDSLAFEEWLQWIFLPRMKSIVEQGGPLPGVSGIRPMAEVVYREHPLQAKALLKLLDDFDRLIKGAI